MPFTLPNKNIPPCLVDIVQIDRKKLTSPCSGIQETKQDSCIPISSEGIMPTCLNHLSDCLKRHWLQWFHWDSRSFHFTDRIRPSFWLHLILIPKEESPYRSKSGMSASSIMTRFFQIK